MIALQIFLLIKLSWFKGHSMLLSSAHKIEYERTNTTAQAEIQRRHRVQRMATAKIKTSTNNRNRILPSQV